MHWLSTRRAKTVMVLPTLIIYAVFIIVPVFVAIYYSFTDYSGLGKAGFVGIQNYTRMFHDTLFLIALRNTVVVLICSVVFLLAGSFLTALLMNVSFRGNAFFKMVVFAPYVIVPIIIGIIWGYLLNPNYGLVNSVLRNLGLDALQSGLPWRWQLYSPGRFWAFMQRSFSPESRRFQGTYMRPALLTGQTRSRDCFM